jgi:preprotein translocase subunit SecD
MTDDGFSSWITAVFSAFALAFQSLFAAVSPLPAPAQGPMIEIILETSVPEANWPLLEQRAKNLGIGNLKLQRQVDGTLLLRLPQSDQQKVLDTLIRRGLLELYRVAEADTARPVAEIIDSSGQMFVVEAAPLLSPVILQSAEPRFDPVTNMPIVGFVMDAESARVFAEITQQNIGKVLPIVLDGVVLTAPTIATPIVSGSGQIAGTFTVDETTRMAIALSQPPLPADVIVREIRTPQ